MSAWPSLGLRYWLNDYLLNVSGAARFQPYPKRLSRTPPARGFASSSMPGPLQNSV